MSLASVILIAAILTLPRRRLAPCLFTLFVVIGTGGCDSCSPSGTAGPLRPDENTRFHVQDRLGSSALVLDLQGTIIAREASEPYGGSWVSWRAEGVTRPDYRFTGKEHESISGAVAIGVRHYLPAVGRWTSPDPLMTVAPEPHELASRERNPFLYAGGDPLAAADGTGLCVDCKVEHWIQSRWTPAMRAAYERHNGRTRLTERDVAKINKALDTADRVLTELEVALVSCGPPGIAIAMGEGMTIHAGVQALRALSRVTGAASRFSRARKAVVPSKKFNYLFGRATGRTHNIERSKQNLGQMRRLGVPDNTRGYKMLDDHFQGVVQGDANVTSRWTNEHGAFETRESLFGGPSGKFAKFESTWKVLDNGDRSLTTVIPKGG
ncbi:MAG: RHS repeat-associated core domain-containing protein [Myxococcales bacterium]|nr:RHS repeat-associated core domain-containing protein [Myxococcales bacterium]